LRIHCGLAADLPTANRNTEMILFFANNFSDSLGAGVHRLSLQIPLPSVRLRPVDKILRGGITLNEQRICDRAMTQGVTQVRYMIR
jgi:hypothetical protein